MFNTSLAAGARVSYKIDAIERAGRPRGSLGANCRRNDRTGPHRTGPDRTGPRRTHADQ